MSSKIEFEDLTKPPKEESEALVAYFASTVLVYMSRLGIAMRLTQEELLRGSFSIAENMTKYAFAMEVISEERMEEIRQEVKDLSDERYEEMKENGHLEEVKRIFKREKEDGKQ